MKFDCFFIITKRVIRNAKLFAVPSDPFSPMPFAILRDFLMKFDCFFIITERVIRTAKVGICCLFCTFVSYPFCDTKRLLMKFDCFFIIAEIVIRTAKVPISFAVLRDC